MVLENIINERYKIRRREEKLIEKKEKFLENQTRYPGYGYY